jgi:hypothetical protein
MAQEVVADSLGAEWKGYVFRITGGNDKQGFPMVQGIMQNKRIRLLLGDGTRCASDAFIFLFELLKRACNFTLVSQCLDTKAVLCTRL